MGSDYKDLFDGLFDELPEGTSTASPSPHSVTASTTVPVAPITAAKPMILKPRHVSTTMLMVRKVLFDIETGSRPWKEIECFYRPPESEQPGEFDESTVKYGNTKDADKRAAKLEEAKQKHAESIVKWIKDQEDAKAKFVEDAALHPTTGQVLAIGWWEAGKDDKPVVLAAETEEGLLKVFWSLLYDIISSNGLLIGFNIKQFDIPFLIRRSWRLGVKAPPDLIRENRYWNRAFVDLREVWGCGIWQEKGNLNDLSKFFGGPGKSGDGGEFARLWNGTEEEKEKAVEYLKNDVEIMAEPARRMGIL